MMPGLYKRQNIRADIVGVFTNCVPTDAYRGAGRPEATHGIERMVDMLAAELKMDPAEIRLKNFIPKDEFPVPDRHRPDLRYRQLRRRRSRRRSTSSDYKKLREEQAEARAAGPADGHRHFHLRRNLRHRPIARHSRRRLGKRDGEDRTDRQGHGDDRLLAARPGRGDHLRADRRRRTGRRYRRHSGAAWRHRHRAVRHRHVRQPRHGRRRHGHVLRPPGAEGEDQEIRRDAARIGRRDVCQRRRAPATRPASPNRCRRSRAHPIAP